MLLAVIRVIYPNLLSLQRNQVKFLLLCMLISALLFGFLEAEQLFNSLSAGFFVWLAWFATGFCIGVGQELLYRGLLFTSLSRFISMTTAGLLTTAAFVIAPLHSTRLWEYLQDGHITVVALLVAIYIAASTLFQWLRNHTGNVIVPALVHGIGNAITWVAVFSL